MSTLPYTHDELHAKYRARVYRGDAREAAFLLGGIGTGNVSVGARGELRDWELFNQPDKGKTLPYTFFALHLRDEEGNVDARVLESRLQPPFARSHGFDAPMAAGLPRFPSSSLRAEYPFVEVELRDPTLPVAVKLEAFTPFVPLDAEASGYPAAVLRYRIRNRSAMTVFASVAGTLANAACRKTLGTGIQEFREDESGKWRGLRYACDAAPAYVFGDSASPSPTDPSAAAPSPTTEHLPCGSMALVTADPSVTSKPRWLGAGGWSFLDGAEEFWTDFSTDGRLEPDPRHPSDTIPDGARTGVGALAIAHDLAPGEERVFEFVLAWHFPYRPKGWDTTLSLGQAASACGCEGGGCQPEERATRNYYATQFPDAWAAATRLLDNLPRLEKASREFRRTLFRSTLPAAAIEAAAANITVIRSPTCFRADDGTFYGWEGCGDTAGCCHGTCTHVWNYAQTLAFLFPELERSMRRVEFGFETDADGRMAFRNEKKFTGKNWDFHPAADGQMGAIVRLYREWKLAGDDAFLRELWDGAARALDYAFKHWDADGDCVLDSQQHNTYDIEFYGPNSLVNSIFFAALKAGAEMAAFVGDTERAARYREALAQGAARMDALLWNGEYYIQKLEDVNAYRYQYGEGCLSDQLLGQMLAHVAGLGYVLPEGHVRQAILSVFKYNFMHGLTGHGHAQRTYALNDEAGLLLCTWPRGARPILPFVYSDEVWTGIEYQVAAHLVHEGFVDEGLCLVKAVRDRHDGYRRNPWNEVECGHHYARAMSSWALLTELSGFRYDMAAGTVDFDPKVSPEDFRCFWSTGKAWGTYEQKIDPTTGARTRQLRILHGDKEAVRLAESQEGG